MFTFGRDRERSYAIEHVGSEEKAQLLLSAIDAVHDFLDGDTSREALEQALMAAMVEGKSGVWESAGNWILKLCQEDPSFQSLWLGLARHGRANVRFRVACDLHNIPEPAKAELSELLGNDSSKKVREMAIDRIEEERRSKD